MDSIAALKALPSLLFVGGANEDVDFGFGLLQQALHEEGADEAGATGEQHVMRHGHLRKRPWHWRFEDELAVLDHHLLLSGALLFTEDAEGVAKL